MEFNNEKAIFIQIADFIGETILAGKWREESRIPSVRDMAATLEVNPNTVMRTYTYLQEKEIVRNRRGIGYFVSPDASEKIVTLKRDDFIRTDLPKLIKTMRLLDIDFDDLKEISRQAIGAKDENPD
ncbi:MAG: GntR family transcriptional regulator [Proteobacteria bacterium]|nr:GntR family transcriptional regulator [Pseudomonadota bacterium]